SNPEILEIELDNYDLDFLENFIKTNIPDHEIGNQPLSKHEHECLNGNYMFAIEGTVQVDPFELKQVETWWKRRADGKGYILIRVTDNRIPIRAKDKFERVDVLCTSYEDMVKLKDGHVDDVTFEFELSTVVGKYNCYEMQLEVGDVFVHPIEAEQVRFDLATDNIEIDEDFEHEYVEPYVTDMINSRLETEASKIKDEIEANILLLESGFLMLLKEADESGLLKYNDKVDSLDDIDFLRVAYSGISATFTIWVETLPERTNLNNIYENEASVIVK
ncbi:MAG: hypothetical protein QW303_08085, partial [Nitrososphaerota archaeon]